MPPSRSPDPPRIRQLTPRDDRSSFASGNESLDRYFRLYAGQNQFKHHLGVTYVAVDSDRIAGFMTVAAGEIEAEGLPHGMPILRLARLAVHLEARGGGIGEALLFESLRLAVSMKATVACAGVVVDAKSDAVAFYSRYGFIAFEAFEGASPERPRTTPMFLAVRKIEAALIPADRRKKR
ncbi:MAG: GNAT family N-acetyltransferase [Vicinamibacteria bacterium]